MKYKILHIVIGFWMGTSVAFGQDAVSGKSVNATSKKTEISLNFGIAPYEWEREVTSFNPDSHWSDFVITVQGMYQVANWLDVGAIVGWYYDSESDNHFEMTMMLAGRGNWIHKRSFKLYSEIDFGTKYSTDNKWEVGMQWTLLGMNIGFGKNFFGQVELGLGSKGLLVAGIGYRF